MTKFVKHLHYFNLFLSNKQFSFPLVCFLSTNIKCFPYYRCQIYSFNNPLSFINLIKYQIESKFSAIKKVLLTLLVLFSISSSIFPQNTNINKNEVTLCIMPFTGMDDSDNYIIANLLASILPLYSEIKMSTYSPMDSQVIYNYIKKYHLVYIYTNFMYLNSKCMKTDYTLFGTVSDINKELNITIYNQKLDSCHYIKRKYDTNTNITESIVNDIGEIYRMISSYIASLENL